MSDFDDRFQQAREELINLLSTEAPDLDTSDGTVAYDLIVRPAAVTYAQLFDDIDTMRDQMSLLQVLQSESVDDDLLDNLLSNFNVVRETASNATGTLNVYTQQTNNVYVPQTTEITCGDVSLRPTKSYVGTNTTVVNNNTDTVEYVRFTQVGDNLWVFSITASTLDPPETSLSAGQICTIYPQSTQIQSVVVASSFSSGVSIESSSSLIRRAATGVNARIMCGADQIKALLQDNSVVSVYDTAVFGMGDEEMLRDKYDDSPISRGGSIDVYVKTSNVPSSTSATLTTTLRADGKWAATISATTFPGAYGVENVKYGTVLLDSAASIELGYTHAEGDPVMSEAAHARYSKYQTMTLVLDTDDIPGTTVGTTATITADVLYMAGVEELQDYIDDPSIRNYSYDSVLKAIIPILTSATVSIQYAKGVVAPTVAQVQQAIANAVNVKPVGAEYLSSAEVIAAVHTLFSDGLVQMPVNLYGVIWMPDGTRAHAFGNNYLKAPDSAGISYRNTGFFCYPGNVEVTLEEIV